MGKWGSTVRVVAGLAYNELPRLISTFGPKSGPVRAVHALSAIANQIQIGEKRAALRSLRDLGQALCATADEIEAKLGGAVNVQDVTNEGKHA